MRRRYEEPLVVKVRRQLLTIAESVRILSFPPVLVDGLGFQLRVADVGPRFILGCEKSRG